MESLVAKMKTFIYNLIISSHVVYYLFPILHFLVEKVLFRMVKNTDQIADEAGETMNVTKWNGKTYPPFGKERLSTVKDVKIRENDVILCGYPKTGCHWIFEILNMVVTKKAELTKYGKEIEMIDATPHFALDSLYSPRVLNSHVLYEDLPKGVVENRNKIILTIRNPKDTVLSYYHHTKNLHFFYKYDGTFDNYFKMFMKGELDYGDYFDHYMSWNQVIKEKQNTNEVFLLEFEEMKENPVKKIMEVAEFLDVSITQEFAEEVARVSSFDNMKRARSKKSKMFRKGIVGDWKSTLTEAQGNEIDTAWRERMVDFELPSQKVSVS